MNRSHLAPVSRYDLYQLDPEALLLRCSTDRDCQLSLYNHSNFWKDYVKLKLNPQKYGFLSWNDEEMRAFWLTANPRNEEQVNQNQMWKYFLKLIVNGRMITIYGQNLPMKIDYHDRLQQVFRRYQSILMDDLHLKQVEGMKIFIVDLKTDQIYIIWYSETQFSEPAGSIEIYKIVHRKLVRQLRYTQIEPDFYPWVNEFSFKPLFNHQIMIQGWSFNDDHESLETILTKSFNFQIDQNEDPLKELKKSIIENPQFESKKGLVEMTPGGQIQVKYNYHLYPSSPIRESQNPTRQTPLNQKLNLTSNKTSNQFINGRPKKVFQRHPKAATSDPQKQCFKIQQPRR